jgi:hypothetical protein
VTPEVVETHATFSQNAHDTGIIFKVGLFVSPEDHVAGVKLDGGKRTWTVPLQTVLDALKAAGYKVTAPSGTSKVSR